VTWRFPDLQGRVLFYPPIWSTKCLAVVRAGPRRDSGTFYLCQPWGRRGPVKRSLIVGLRVSTHVCVF